MSLFLRLFSAIAALSMALSFWSSPALAADFGTVSGNVLLEDGSPATDADVEIIDLHRRARVDEDGAFRFESIPVGSHVLVVDSLRHGGAVREILVEMDQEVSLELYLVLGVHRDEIVVSASPTAQTQLQVGAAVGVLSGDELLRRSQPSLGATLSSQAGVNETAFGAAASRPIVRGLGGDRVRILQGGVGSGDLSETSPDHAVTAETLTAERIEILRGPSTLLYGSSAIGGVINVIDESIPSHQVHRAVTGHVDIRLGSVADERTGALVLRGGMGSWAWSLSGLTRETDDYRIPGFARVEDPSDHEAGEDAESEPNPRGALPNSDLESDQLGAGLSYFFGDNGEVGFVGVSSSIFETNYGVPGGEEEEGEGGVRIDMSRIRYDLETAVTRPFGLFAGLKARLGVTDYEHDEIEGNGEIGTHFENDAWEARIELVQKEIGHLSGAFGIQGGKRDFLALGEEAVVAPNTTESLAFFVFEEIEIGASSLQLGARWESRDITVVDPTLPDRYFQGSSLSLGFVWKPGATTLGASLARSVKFPSPEELYSNGAHAATRTFEIGNPALEEESSLGLDVFYRHKSDRLRAELTFFFNDFSEFIYPAFTGEEREGLQLIRFEQSDAELLGAELEMGIELYGSEKIHLDLQVLGDFVQAELADGSNVPRIPPLRLGAGFDLRRGPLSLAAEIRWVDAQSDVAPHETPTESYTLVNAFVGYRWLSERMVYDLLLRADNLTDEEVRLHTSYVKDLAPRPGRDLHLSVRLTF